MHVLTAEENVQHLSSAFQDLLANWELSDTPARAAAKDFVCGCRHAELGNPYEGAESFYAWLRAPEHGIIIQYDNGRVKVSAVSAAQEPTHWQDRVSMLEKFTKSISDNIPGIIEPVALATSRILARDKQYERALDALNKVGALASHHVVAAQHTLDIAMQGKEVPTYLSRYVGDESDFLKKHRCKFPFMRFDVTFDGSAYLCCGHFLPTSIGNVHEDESVINSDTACAIRRSVIDGTYKYCLLHRCTEIANAVAPQKGRALALVPNLDAGRHLTDADFRVENPEIILCGLDLTCNLSCPQCRNERYTASKEEIDKQMRAVDTVILPLLKTAREVLIDPAGELFASVSMRRVLSWLNKDKYPDLTVKIISNGTLFSKKEWDRFSNIHDMPCHVRISTDALTKQSYETIRRGGNHEVFTQNLEFLAGLRRENKLIGLDVSFCYQRTNFREMPGFVQYAMDLGCDHVLLERLYQISMTTEEFREHAVHLHTNPLHAEFLKIIEDPIFQHPMVVKDF